MKDILIVVLDYDEEDYILQEKLIGPSGQLILQLAREALHPSLTYEVCRVKDLPKRPLPKAVLVLGQETWKAIDSHEKKRIADVVYRTDKTPKEVLLPTINQQTCETRYLDLKNRFLQISRNLTE